MKIEDLHKLKLGDMLICTRTIGEIKRGQVFYFTTYYTHKNKISVLYLSRTPINSKANASGSYEPGIVEYFETVDKLREEKINIILE